MCTLPNEMKPYSCLILTSHQSVMSFFSGPPLIRKILDPPCMTTSTLNIQAVLEISSRAVVRDDQKVYRATNF